MLGASPNIARAAQVVAPRILFADRTPPRGLAGMLRGERDQFFTLDYSDDRAVEEFASVLLGDLYPDVVLSVTESGLLPAARLTSLLGLPGTPVEVVRRTRDKVAMRTCLAERVPALAWPFAPGSDEAAVLTLLERHGTCILKPVDGTASRGVRRIEGLSGWARVPASERAGAIVEKLATGVEVGVEAMSHGGRHTVVAVVERRTSPGSVEVAHLTPAPSLSPSDLDRVASATCECLTALGLKDGPSHTELFVSDLEVTVVETHNRPGGDGIADLVRLTTGIDWRRASVAWPCETLEEAAAVGAERAPAAAMVFFTAAPGIVRSVRLDAPKLTGVRVVSWNVDVAPGDRVGLLLSSADRLGAAQLAAGSLEDLDRAVELLLAGSVVITEDGLA